MSLAKAKVSSQGQISIPAEVRKALGIGPGDVVEFDQDDGRIVISRAKGMTFDDVRQRLFPDGSPRKSPTQEELDAGIEQAVAEEFRGEGR